MSSSTAQQAHAAWLHKEIYEALLRCNPTVYHQLEYVELLRMPTFTEYYFLQLFWQGRQLRWVRNTWNRTADATLLSLWSEARAAGETLGELQLTLHREAGIQPIEIAAEFFTLLRTARISVGPQLNSDPWGRDGDEIILRLGVQEAKSTFHWYTAHTPVDWTQLDTLAESLMRLNTRLNQTFMAVK